MIQNSRINSFFPFFKILLLAVSILIIVLTKAEYLVVAAIAVTGMFLWEYKDRNTNKYLASLLVFFIVLQGEHYYDLFAVLRLLIVLYIYNYELKKDNFYSEFYVLVSFMFLFLQFFFVRSLNNQIIATTIMAFAFIDLMVGFKLSMEKNISIGARILVSLCLIYFSSRYYILTLNLINSMHTVRVEFYLVFLFFIFFHFKFTNWESNHWVISFLSILLTILPHKSVALSSELLNINIFGIFLYLCCNNYKQIKKLNNSISRIVDAILTTIPILSLGLGVYLKEVFNGFSPYLVVYLIVFVMISYFSYENLKLLVVEKHEFGSKRSSWVTIMFGLLIIIVNMTFYKNV